MATRHKRTKEERAAIAARMRAYHAKRRAAKARAASGITGSRHPEGAVPMAAGTEAVSPLDHMAKTLNEVDFLRSDAESLRTQVTMLVDKLNAAESRVADLIRAVTKLIDRGGY